MATVRIRFRYSSLLAAGVAPCQIRVTMLNSVLVVEYPWSLLFRSRCPWTPEASRPVPLLRLRHISDNVDCVKHFVGVLTRALRRARHFALVEALPYQPRLARNRFRSGTQSDPCISSVTTSIMITTSNSPVKESGIPNQLLGVQLHTIACSGLSRVRTEFRQLLVIPSLAPHPVKTNGESTGHGYLGDLPSPSHRQVEILAAPFLVAAHRDLGRFHQQEAQQSVALFADVS